MTSSARCIALLHELIEQQQQQQHIALDHSKNVTDDDNNQSKLPDHVLEFLASLFPDALVHEALRMFEHALVVIFRGPSNSDRRDRPTDTSLPPTPLSFAALIPRDPRMVGAAQDHLFIPLPQSTDADGVSYAQVATWIEQSTKHIAEFHAQQGQLQGNQHQDWRTSGSRRTSGTGVHSQPVQIWGHLPTVCMLDGHHCSCPAFQTLVIQQEETLTCPHILGANLACISDSAVVVPLSCSASADLAFHWMCGTGIFGKTGQLGGRS